MIITHGDLDGLASALIAMTLSGQKPEDVHWFSYEPNRDEKWQELLFGSYDNIWFVDMSLRPQELEWARNNIPEESRWIWIDHHKSSAEFDTDGIFDEVHLDTSGKRCAADILWDMLDDHYCVTGKHWGNMQLIESWVEAAHDRDLWMNKHRERNMKLDMILKDALKRGTTTQLLQLCNRFEPDSIVTRFEDAWQTGMKAYENSCKTAKKTLVWMPVDEDANALGICWITGNGSDVADTVYETGDEIIAMLQLFPENVGISLRTRRNDIDLSVVAKAFNGGGHPQAAGGRLRIRHLIGGYETIRLDIVEAIKEG